MCRVDSEWKQGVLQKARSGNRMCREDSEWKQGVLQGAWSRSKSVRWGGSEWKQGYAAEGSEWKQDVLNGLSVETGVCCWRLGVEPG
jgi:hypothetical protein